MSNLPTKTESLPAEKEKRLDREDLLIRYFCESGDKKKAAIEAGYSESFSKAGVYLKFQDRRFLEKLYAYNRAMYAMLLPDLHKARANVAVKLASEENWEKVAKNEKVLQGIEVLAGSRSHDDFTPQPTVQIGSVQNLMLQIHQKPEDSST